MPGGGFAHVLVWQLAKLHADCLLLAVTDNSQSHGSLGTQCCDLSPEISSALDLDRVDADDHVSGLESRLCGRAIGLGFGDQRTRRVLEAEAFSNFPGYALDANSQPTARYLTILLQLRDHIRYGRSRDSKGDSHGPAGWRENCCIDTNHFTFQVEGGSTRVAEIHGGIDLDEIV